MKIILIFLILFSNPVFAKYNRKSWKHWTVKNCQNTRHRVLIKNSLKKPTLSKNGCYVVKGLWLDPYTNKHFTNPRKLDIDHLVPLYEVYLSGGKNWTSQQKKEYANNMSVLIPVYYKANRKKGAKDVANWMPSNKKYHCKYLKTWIQIKVKYKLSMDNKEKRFIYQKKCKIIVDN